MSSIMKGLVDEQDIEETKKLSAQEKFKRSMARAGYDMDAGAKRLQDLLDRQKKEREELEKKELKNVSEDDTLQFAKEKTPRVNPYGGLEDVRLRGAIGEELEKIDEDLRKWFKEKWVRFGPDGKIRGACARGSSSEGKPKCLPQAKAHSLGKKGRASAAARKRREDPNPERSGPAKNVATKKKSNEGVQENMQANQNLSIQNLATISDEALDKAYGYGRSSPGNTFGWQANLMSAAYAKKMIDAGVTDIEKISDAIHKGWNVTAQKFVQNPDQFDDTEKLRQAGKLEAKLQQRAKLMKINYAQLDNEEQEKDRVVARALLQAIKGQQGVAESSLEEIDRRGFLKGAGAAAVAGVTGIGKAQSSNNTWKGEFLVPGILEKNVKYIITDVKQQGGIFQVRTKRIGPSGESTTVRLIDCDKEMWKYIEDDGVKVSNSQWTQFVRGSSAHGIFKSVCSGSYDNNIDKKKFNRDRVRRQYANNPEMLKSLEKIWKDEDAGKYKESVQQGVAEGYSDMSGLMSASNLNNSYIITAELAEGGKKKFRVKAQNERVAIEKFKKHHSMAKIINVEEEGVNEGSKYPRNPASYHLKNYPVPPEQMVRPVKKPKVKPNEKPEKKPDEKLDELKCWPGYSRVKGVPAGAPGSCKKKTNEEHQQCPECGGAMYEVSLMNEKKDACYYKVKSRYKVWPSAYASGALVKCRKKGAKNWGNKSNESHILEGINKVNRKIK